MKTPVILLLSLILFTACQEECPERYTQNAPEIDLYKQGIAAYVAQDWDGLRSNYAEGAKIQFNTTRENPATIDQAIDGHKNTVAMLSDYGFKEGDSEYERVITDDDEMWVNYWGTWYGVVAATGKRVEIPVHLTARFIDSKIVTEHGIWNTLELAEAFDQAAALAAVPKEDHDEHEE